MVSSSLEAGAELYRRYGLSEFVRAIKRFALRETFGLWQRLGVHVTPVHFYQPIPDTREIGDVWNRPRSESLPGIDLDPEPQLECLERFAAEYADEYDTFPRRESARTTQYQYYRDNRQFGTLDAEILYSMVRDRNPDRIVEVGSGHSTKLIAQAVRENDGECTYTVVDPYPDRTVRSGIPGVSRLLKRKVQDVPLSLFERLGGDDILFIDSSHVLAIGSDVHYEYLEVLPRLNEGVVVHLHDIFLPEEYPEYWITERRWFWTEQYVLRAFLAFNDAYEIRWASNYMHQTHPAAVADAFDAYDPATAEPSSFWIERTDR